jgi:predicted glutamine amidotransferase
MRKQIPDLSGFTGTEQYHYLNFMKNLKFTDGWAYLAKELGCFWLADIVASVQNLKKIRENNSFIVWRIEVKDSEAVVSAYTDCEEDGSYSPSKRLYKQKVMYTDFPEGEFDWYQQGDVVLLKEEH